MDSNEETCSDEYVYASENKGVPNDKISLFDTDDGFQNTAVQNKRITVAKKVLSRTNSSEPIVSKKENPNAISSNQKPSAASVEDSDSDSGDDYLVDPNSIDLNSTFFDPSFGTLEEKTMEHPIFDCNIGIKSLSDSENDSDLENVIEPEQPNRQEHLHFDKYDNFNTNLKKAKDYFSNFKSTNFGQEETVDITTLLAMGETTTNKPLRQSQLLKKVKKQSAKVEAADTDSDWEEVAEKRNTIEDVIVTLGTTIKPKLDRNESVIAAQIKRQINRRKKEQQLLIHKTHLLCWIGYGNNINRILNSTKLMEMALSLNISYMKFVPPKPSCRVDLDYFEQITKWYNNQMSLKINQMYPKLNKLPPTATSLALQIRTRATICKRDHIFIFIILLRAIGIECRLVINLPIAPIRPSAAALCTITKTPAASQSTAKKINPKTTVDNSSSHSSSNLKKISNLKNFSSSNTAKIVPMQNKLADIIEKSTYPNTTVKIKQSSKLSKFKDNEKQTDIKQLSHRPKDNSCLNSSSHNSSNPNKTANLGNRSNKNILNIASNISADNNKQLKQSNLTVQIKESSKHNKFEDDKKQPEVKHYSLKPKATLLYTAKEVRIPISTIKPTDDHVLPHTNRSTQEKFDKSSKTVYMQDEIPSKTENLKRYHVQLPTSSLSNKRTKMTQAFPQKLIKSSQTVSFTSPILSKKLRNIINYPISTRTKTISNSVPQLDGGDDWTKGLIKRKKPMSQQKEESATKKKKNEDWKVEDIFDSFTEDDDDDDINKIDFWVEIYNAYGKKWIAADVCKSEVHCVHTVRAKASKPIRYVFAWNNNSTIKDVSPRYCTHWFTHTRKQRIDDNWLNETLKRYKDTSSRNKAEDNEFSKFHLKEPFPSSISEYKNHPLYALERHLLKFEAIYPANALTLGFIRNEPVYSRDCVHTCRSREIWVKEARVVKPKEEPYKIVKARPKWDRHTKKMLEPQPLEIFGYWQTGKYEPPTAANGLVPRNPYGNVELFKPEMLPKKTVHLQLPGLNRTCKKLQIDCAQAVTGFDFHSGSSHPVYDGFVVCEEFSELVVDQWFKDQEEAERKENEKREQKVIGNWKKLIKGLLIRRRLQLKYNFSGINDEVEKRPSVPEIKTKSVTLKVKTRKNCKK